MKKVLIISPHFPPVNTADMHRVRQSIYYFREFGWDAEVVMVDEQFVEAGRDHLLAESLPPNIVIHKVKAWSPRLTRKIGLGSIALRSLWSYYVRVGRLLKRTGYDLVFFSTTAYPVAVLGRVWKNKFKIPYVIDMQDPWRSDHYLQMPRNMRPPKFWFSYRLDKYMEAFAMRSVDGLMAVSKKYIDVLQSRYMHLKQVPSVVIPFGAFEKDMELLHAPGIKNNFFSRQNGMINIAYVGRGGYDMHHACRLIFRAFRMGLEESPGIFDQLRFYFIGTNYDPSGHALKTIEPVAVEEGVQDKVFEFPARISYAETLKVLSDADILVVPGSDDPAYTASKIYPYVLLQKPLITVFNKQSSVNQFMNDTAAGTAITFTPGDDEQVAIRKIYTSIREMGAPGFSPAPFNQNAFQKYTSRYMTQMEAIFFDEVLKHYSE